MTQRRCPPPALPPPPLPPLRWRRRRPAGGRRRRLRPLRPPPRRPRRGGRTGRRRVGWPRRRRRTRRRESRGGRPGSRQGRAWQRSEENARDWQWQPPSRARGCDRGAVAVARPRAVGRAAGRALGQSMPLVPTTAPTAMRADNKPSPIRVAPLERPSTHVAPTGARLRCMMHSTPAPHATSKEVHINRWQPPHGQAGKQGDRRRKGSLVLNGIGTPPSSRGWRVCTVWGRAADGPPWPTVALREPTRMTRPAAP